MAPVDCFLGRPGVIHWLQMAADGRSQGRERQACSRLARAHSQGFAVFSWSGMQTNGGIRSWADPVHDVAISRSSPVEAVFCNFGISEACAHGNSILQESQACLPCPGQAAKAEAKPKPHWASVRAPHLPQAGGGVPVDSSMDCWCLPARDPMDGCCLGPSLEFKLPHAKKGRSAPTMLKMDPSNERPRHRPRNQHQNHQIAVGRVCLQP